MSTSKSNVGRSENKTNNNSSEVANEMNGNVIVCIIVVISLVSVILADRICKDSTFVALYLNTLAVFYCIMAFILVIYGVLKKIKMIKNAKSEALVRN